MEDLSGEQAESKHEHDAKFSNRQSAPLVECKTTKPDGNERAQQATPLLVARLVAQHFLQTLQSNRQTTRGNKSKRANNHYEQIKCGHVKRTLVNSHLILIMAALIIEPMQTEEISPEKLRQLFAHRQPPLIGQHDQWRRQQQQAHGTNLDNTEQMLMQSNETTTTINSHMAKRQATTTELEREALPDTLQQPAAFVPIINQNEPQNRPLQQTRAQPTTSQSAATDPNKLHIVRLFAPEAVQNGTQNVTMDCMFKFDKKLDQRLTIKWFFNDELEPIYQWIPELNKRVYSDKYEQFLDKSYQVNEDVDFMLQAYKLLLVDSSSMMSSADVVDSSNQLTELVLNDEQANGSPEVNHHHHQQHHFASSRKLLANRLNRLAKLGSEHSRQLLASLRFSLAMQNEQFSKFRALRLIRPTTELNGRFTCSISSLEGDDLQSTRLVVFEPAQQLELSVSRAHNQANLYNLSCAAARVFPRPTLSLYRQRIMATESNSQLRLTTNDAASSSHHHRASMMNNRTQQQWEQIAGVQNQLIVSNVARNGHRRRPLVVGADGTTDWSQSGDERLANNQIVAVNSNHQPTTESIDLYADASESSSSNTGQSHESLLQYEIFAWTLIDESTLSSAQPSLFECVLTIDGAPNYEQRQSVLVQKGWHMSQSPALALARSSTLVGTLGALAALMCFLVALVSAGLIFKLLRKQTINSRKVSDSAQVIAVERARPNKHDDDDNDKDAKQRRATADRETDSSCSGTSTTNASSSTAANASTGGNIINQPGSDYNEFGLAPSNNGHQATVAPVAPTRHSIRSVDFIADSDGVYRVPARSVAIGQQQHQQQAIDQTTTFPYDNSYASVAANRFVIGANRGWQVTNYAAHTYNAWNQPHISMADGQLEQYEQQQSTNSTGQTKPHTTTTTRNYPATISVNGKQLYC